MTFCEVGAIPCPSRVSTAFSAGMTIRGMVPFSYLSRVLTQPVPQNDDPGISGNERNQDAAVPRNSRVAVWSMTHCCGSRTFSSSPPVKRTTTP